MQSVLSIWLALAADARLWLAAKRACRLWDCSMFSNRSHWCLKAFNIWAPTIEGPSNPSFWYHWAFPFHSSSQPWKDICDRCLIFIFSESSRVQAIFACCFFSANVPDMIRRKMQKACHYDEQIPANSCNLASLLKLLLLAFWQNAGTGCSRHFLLFSKNTRHRLGSPVRFLAKCWKRLGLSCFPTQKYGNRVSWLSFLLICHLHFLLFSLHICTHFYDFPMWSYCFTMAFPMAFQCCPMASVCISLLFDVFHVSFCNFSIFIFSLIAMASLVVFLCFLQDLPIRSYCFSWPLLWLSNAFLPMFFFVVH